MLPVLLSVHQPQLWLQLCENVKHTYFEKIEGRRLWRAGCGALTHPQGKGVRGVWRMVKVKMDEKDHKTNNREDFKKKMNCGSADGCIKKGIAYGRGGSSSVR